jgi:beta-1,4-mannosyl-glycoprotein beta-1,4-N-acetylglucosaminyltransferase
MKVVDCFIFYNELDLLHLRFEELYSVVDKFVIVEANHTFAGNPKEWNYESNKERYAKYADKIMYVKVEDMPNDGNAWNNEYHQRNAIQSCFTLFEDDDAAIISDVDEIPNSEAIRYIKKNTSIIPVRIGMEFYNYNFNCKISTFQNNVPIVYRIKDLTGKSIQSLRERYNIHIMPNAGWHFSWFGDADFCKNKIKNFAHQELNNDYFLERLDTRRDNYEDYYQESGRNWKFNHIPISKTLPKCVIERRFQFIEKYIDEPKSVITFITYGDTAFEKSRTRLIKEAQDTGIFKRCIGYTPDDLDEEFKMSCKSLLSQKRGGGYWCWKPHVVLKTMQSIPENEWILYADAGCTLVRERKEQVLEQIEIMEKENKLVSAYQMNHLEKSWTKGDMFNYFGIVENKHIKETGQYVGGVFLVKNHEKTRRIFERMLEIMSGLSFLIDDSPSIISNDSSFNEHRHDQSLFSIIRKLNPDITYVIPKDETYHGNAFVQALRLKE